MSIDDMKILDFWECLREYVFYDLFKKYKYCDCIDTYKLKRNIEVKFEGDYLVFYCNSCGKIYHKEHMPIQF